MDIKTKTSCLIIMFLCNVGTFSIITLQIQIITLIYVPAEFSDVSTVIWRLGNNSKYFMGKIWNIPQKIFKFVVKVERLLASHLLVNFVNDHLECGRDVF